MSTSYKIRNLQHALLQRLQKYILYINTIRYLKVRQIYYRLFYALARRPKLLTKDFEPKRRSWIHAFDLLIELPSRISTLDEYHFAQEQGSINDKAIWNSTERSKLWLYNLHYFDELNYCDSELRQELLLRYIKSWLFHNAPFQGCGWEPYPLSLRIVNWIKWVSRYPANATSDILASLLLQSATLERSIEYHILANHLFANGKALIFAGAYFDGASAWLKKGISILDREVREQFLVDGGHFERSPMYHATLLTDLSDLVYLADCSNIPELKERVPLWQSVIVRGIRWLSLMSHPDGDIAFFNDAAFGIALRGDKLKRYAEQCCKLSIKDIPVDQFSYEYLSPSGYCIVHLNKGEKAILDLAPIEPSYQPGHAHADTLSFELSLFEQRFLVNSGTSKYVEDVERYHQRSTVAHNTVTVCGKNSSEVWASFRVGKRAKAVHFSANYTKGGIEIGCGHDGYQTMFARRIHRREWQFSPNKLVIKDAVTGTPILAHAFFYLHPDIQVNIESSNVFCCILHNGERVNIAFYGAEMVDLIDSYWYPHFGVKISNRCLKAQFTHGHLETSIFW